MNLIRLLFDPRGRISRVLFVAIATLLVITKVAGDFALSRFLFQRDWSLHEYLFPHLAALSDHSSHAWRFDAVLLLWATPFAWMGLCLLAKRLRSANAPVSLIVLFFVPIAKFFLFTVLCVLPERENNAPQRDRTPAFRKWAPESSLASACLGAFCAAILGIVVVLLATQQPATYLMWLFLGLPFLMGFVSAWIHGLARPRRLRQSLLTAYLALALTGGILLSVAVEGVVCLAMAAPIALCEATAGAWLAHLLQQSTRNQSTGSPSVVATCLTLPILMLIEQPIRCPTEYAVTTTLLIKAKPEAVWKHVVSFSAIPPPTDWIFRLGIAYPERAEIEGSGVGAIRHCIFSTGTFVEPITAWDPPERLAFGVTEQPDPLSELSPYRNLHPPHLHDYFQSHRGEFLLRKSCKGTLLCGTTWYSNRIEPELYWKFWSDALIHRIHQRVLEHIKQEVESNLAEDSPLQN